MLLFETDEEQLRLFTEKHGNVEMHRLGVGGDGSWAFRSYNNNVKSPYGQAALIGACTKSVIAWGHRILKCYICSRAKHEGKVAKQHICQINHQGSVKSMESETGTQHLVPFTENTSFRSSLPAFWWGSDSGHEGR